MKLFVFVDLHGDLKVFNRIKDRVKKEKPDALLFAGDVTFFGFGIKTWLKKLDSFKLPIFIVPGNHELEEEVEVYSKNLKYVKNVHLKSVNFKSILIIGCGGGGFTEEHASFERSEKEFEKDIKKLKIKGNKSKIILIAHQPPYNTATDYLPHWGKVGSKSIRNFIKKYQPLYCITGHIHENFGKRDKIGKTEIINPGPEGEIIEF